MKEFSIPRIMYLLDILIEEAYKEHQVIDHHINVYKELMKFYHYFGDLVSYVNVD